MEEMFTNNQKLCLGIDLGTTSVKVCLLEVDSGQSIYSTSEVTEADVPSDLGAKGSEQDVCKILLAVDKCLNRVTVHLRPLVSCIGVSGQMHGVLLWNGKTSGDIKNGHLVAKETSPLFTWQDQRATKEFLTGLPPPSSHQHLATGFGCVTLFWLQRCRPEVLTEMEYSCVGNIVDFLVALLCGIEKPVMSTQLAASWGYFDTVTTSWNCDILQESGFPVHLLPRVIEAGSVVGRLKSDWLGIQTGTPVLVGMGDLQCSIKSAVELPQDAVLNMSTSCQVAFPITDKTISPPSTKHPEPVNYFPYFEGRHLAVAASLNGGNVLVQFVHTLRDWTSNLTGVTVTNEQIWNKLKTLEEHTSDHPMKIVPTIYGERHCPNQHGSVSAITEDSLSLRAVYRALCRGLVENLHSMMPGSFLVENDVTRMVTSGSVIERNSVVRQYIQEMYGKCVPVVAGNSADSAFGAALVARQWLMSAEDQH